MNDSMRIWQLSGAASLLADPARADLALAGIAGQGFNTVYLSVPCGRIVPSTIYPELVAGNDTRLKDLRRLVKMTDKHGLRMLLYMQPLFCLPAGDPFWKAHPGAGGAVYTRHDRPGRVRSMCTSVAEVREFIRADMAGLFDRIPGLGGLILITASEAPAHCYSKYPYTHYKIGGGAQETPPLGCSRCEKLHPTDVVTHLIQDVRDGVRRSSKEAGIVVWNWSWSMYEPNPCPTIINRLPGDVTLLIGFERGGQKTILGKTRRIDEYSLSYVGPSQTFVRCAALARKRGLGVMAKLEISHTHELLSVPNIPLIGNLFDKVAGMRKHKVDSFLGSYLGGARSANTMAFNRFWNYKKLPPKSKALRDFAHDYFPGCDPRRVEQAWRLFAKAMDDYPFCIPIIYDGPKNYALSYITYPRQAKRAYIGIGWIDTPQEKRGEWLEMDWMKEYTWSEVRRGFGLVWRGWEKGVETLARALAGCEHEHARQELDNATICGLALRSGWNVLRIFNLRKTWSPAKLKTYLSYIRDDIETARAALPILERDRRYCMFDFESVSRKVRALEKQLKQYG